MELIFDSHAHYDDEAFESDREELLSGLSDRGAGTVVDVCANFYEIANVLDLVSRYDSATGQSIPLHDRIGLLDRKMRVINENAADEEEWMNWTLRAYQSTYGYEFQGDSLLLARENLFCTFLENCRAKWQHDPSMVQMRRIATVLSWNLWQMDGLTYTIPYHTQEDEEPKQIGLFEMVSEKPDPVVCQIKDWRSKLIFKFVSMTKGAKR